MANSEIDSQIESLQETSIFEKEIDILEKRGAKLSNGIQIKIERWHSVSLDKIMLISFEELILNFSFFLSFLRTKINMSNSEIDFQIESLQETSIFEKEIDRLEREGAVLLGAIQILEDYLNFKKKEGKVDGNDIKEMQEMIEKFFRILSLIDAFQVLSENQMVTDENIDSFISIVSSSYSIRFKKFVNDLELSIEK